MTTDIGTSVGEFIDTATDNFVQNRFKTAFFDIGVFLRSDGVVTVHTPFFNIKQTLCSTHMEHRRKSQLMRT